MNIYVVRHGQTDWNLRNVLQGSSDIELNNTGKNQATILEKNLANINFDYIICSPLKRAIQTAEIINKYRNVPIFINDSIKERSFGTLEGKKSPKISEYWDYLKNINKNNVEKVQDFFKRINEFMELIITRYRDKDLLIVAHYGVMIAIDCYINGFKPNYDLNNYFFDNATYVKYKID